MIIPSDVTVTLRNISGLGKVIYMCNQDNPNPGGTTNIILEGDNSGFFIGQQDNIENLIISGDGSLTLNSQSTFNDGSNTVINGGTITAPYFNVGQNAGGNSFTVNDGAINLTEGGLWTSVSGETTDIIINGGNVSVFVNHDDLLSYTSIGIGGNNNSSNIVNVTVTDGTITFNSNTDGLTGDYFIKASSITFGTTNVKSAWDAKTWSADGYQNFGPLRATYTASSHTLVLATNPDPAPVITLETPLTLEALSDGTIRVYDPQSGMQYSLNGGAKQTMSGNTEINVSQGDKVAFYGNGTSITSYKDTMITGGTADVKVYGNIMSLVDEENFATATTLPETYTFYKLFYHYEHLTDASGLLLPATTLASANTHCYAEMFSNCDNLVAGPSELPATTLSLRCYQEMFSSCPSLTVAPILPATTLEGYCYYRMFRGCTSLTEAPVLPAPELTGNCYREMFSGCSSLNSITCLATSVINSSNSTSSWVNGVASLGTFTKASGANVSTDAGGSGSTWPRSIRGIPEGWDIDQ